MNSKKVKNRVGSKFLNFKRSILLGSVTTLVAVPCAIVTSTASQLSSHTYTMGNQTFSSKNAAVNYVKNNSKKVATKTEGNNSTWQVTYNGKTKTFNDPESLREFADNLINKVGTYATSNTDSSNIDWSKMYKVNSSKAGEQLTKTIYQGLHDKSYDDIDAAIDSFYTGDNVKTAYYFNGIYFSDKTDLKNYLSQTYLPSNSANDYTTIILKGPNGTKSSAISINDSASATVAVKSFIQNNSNVSVQYTNSSTGEKVNITESNVNSTMSKVQNSDLSYVSMKSNEGESRYVLDNYDDSNLIGPYMYNGVLDIGAFKNKNMWKKTNNITKQVYVESKVNTMIGTFFSSIITDDKALSMSEYEKDPTSNIPLFRTTLLAADGENSYFVDENGKKIEGEVTLDEWFLKQLDLIAPSLKTDVTNALIQLMKGKKYNTFYKICILYSYLMQRAVSYGLDQNVIDLIVFYFTQVCNYIQDAIELIIMDDSLLVNDDGDKFNVKDLFEIGNMNYDLNTNPDYFFNKIKKWPKLIAAMDAYLGGYNNLVMTSGLTPFASYNQSYLVDYSVISEASLDSIKPQLESIYTAFSQTTYSDFLGVYMVSSTNSKVKEIYSNYDSSQWEQKLDEATANHTNASIGIILKTAVQQNNQHQKLAKIILTNEIRIYLATGKILTAGYLSLLYSKTPSANKIDEFVDFVQKHQDLDAYKIYLVFLLDMRMNTNLINSSALSSTTNFATTLSKIILLTLGSSLLVSQSVKNLYYSGSSSGSSHLSTSSSDTSSSAGSITQSLIDRLEELRNIPEPENSQLFDVISNGSSGSIQNANNLSQSLSGSSSSIINEKGIVSDMGSEFERVSNRGSITSNKSTLSFAGVDAIEMKNMVSSSKTPKVTLHYEKNGDIYAQVRRIGASSITSIDNVATGTNGTRINTSLSSGMSVSSNTLSLISLTDELQLNNTTQFWTKTLTTKGGFAFDYPDMAGGRMSYVRANSAGYNVNAVTKFTSSFRKKISINKIYNIAQSAWESAKKVYKAIKNTLLPIISVALSSLETYLFIFDLLKVDTTTDYYVYTTSDGTEFIWDGGLTVSKFLGFDVKQTKGIDSMELIDPVQITLPQVEEYYYYNGNKYYDINDLKRAELLYIIKNKYTGLPSKFSLNYSLSSSDTSSSTLDDLVSKVMTSIGATKKDDGTYDFTKINRTSDYISSVSSGFKGAQNLNQNDYGNIADVIVKSIRQTNIAMLPDVGTDGKTTGTLSTFVLPEKYYDPTTKTIKKNETSNQYIIDDSANTKNASGDFQESNETKAVEESKTKLKSTFKDKLKDIIRTKNVLTTDYLLTDKKFSELNSSWNIVNVYETTINSNRQYFQSINDARAYVLSSLNFRKNTDLRNTTAYIYKDKYFANENALKNWVLQNLTTI